MSRNCLIKLLTLEMLEVPMKILILLTLLGRLGLAYGADFYSNSMDDYKVLSKASWKPVKARRTYIQYELTKSIQEGPRKLNFKYTFYRARKKRQGELLILFPTISGVTILERTLARYYANRGLDVVIPVSMVRNFRFNKDTVKAMDEGFWRSIFQTSSVLKDLRRVRDYHKTYVMGGSQGGTRAAMILGRGLKIDKAYTFVAGGDFAKIFAQSRVKQVRELRENHMKALNLVSKAEYENYLRANIKFHPEEFCSKRTAELKMLVAMKDTSVPTATQQSLWRGCGYPTKQEIGTGHVLGVLGMWWYRKKALKYFRL